MEYEVLEADSAIGIEKLVREKMGDGWEPLGGMSVLSVSREVETAGTTRPIDGYVFFQAMIHGRMPDAPQFREQPPKEN